MKFAALARCFLIVPVVLVIIPGCRKASELTQEQVAEAVANQAISAYYETTKTVTTGQGSVTLSCSRGGSLTWAEFEEEGDICFSATSNGCVMEGSYGTLTLDGSYDVCGFPPSSSEEGSIEDLDGQTLYITGSMSGSSEGGASKSCDFDLTFTSIDVTDNGDTVTFSSGLTGTLCSDKNVDIGVDITVTDHVTVNET